MTDRFENDIRAQLHAEADSLTHLPVGMREGVQDAIAARRVRVPTVLAPIALGAALFSLVLVGVFSQLRHDGSSPAVAVIGSPSPTAPATATAASSPAASAAATPIPTPSTSAAATASASMAACTPAPTQVDRGNQVVLTAVRASSVSGFDRLVFEFRSATGGGSAPSYQLQPQSNTDFTQDASGRPVHLLGNAGLKVVFNHATAQGGYSGPSDLKPGLPILREVEQVGDFEGVLSWGVGLASGPCYRVTELTSPSRLVLDFRAS